jgi:hypothetical protein
VKWIGAISIVVMFAGCDPVKRIQRHDEQMERMEAVMLDRGICRPDTFIVRRTDTLTRTDTVGEIYIYTDTTTLHDTTTVTRERIRTVLRTITIRDTVLRQITDETALKACRSDQERSEGRNIAGRSLAYYPPSCFAYYFSHYQNNTTWIA